jgi:hypothetical protein
VLPCVQKLRDLTALVMQTLLGEYEPEEALKRIGTSIVHQDNWLRSNGFVGFADADTMRALARVSDAGRRGGGYRQVD